MINHREWARELVEIINTYLESNDSECNEMESKSQKKWYVYIAQARTGRFYVGITTDPQERIKKHNSGKGAMFAVEQGPFKLVYSSQSYPNKSDARKREIQLKGWSREKKQKLISGTWE